MLKNAKLNVTLVKLMTDKLVTNELNNNYGDGRISTHADPAHLSRDVYVGACLRHYK